VTLGILGLDAEHGRGDDLLLGLPDVLAAPLYRGDRRLIDARGRARKRRMCLRVIGYAPAKAERKLSAG
jgi:hypothetical protein